MANGDCLIGLSGGDVGQLKRETNDNMLETKGLKDVPIQISQNDGLDLNDYTETLSAFILSADTPMTIAIQGDWGSGKSSLMHLLEEKMKADSQNQIHTLWFNTWQFSQFNLENQITISFLSRFIDNLEKLSPNAETQESKLKKTLHELANVTGEGTTEPSQYIEDLQLELVKLVKEKCEALNLNRIIVFIDDIDHLMPEKAIELLESLKLFLEIEGCVYVLACDYQLIVQGQKESELKGRLFFEKIIQVAVNMPMSQYKAEKFCQKMLHELDIVHEAGDLALYVKLISLSVGFTPRRVKKLFNHLQLLKLLLIKKDAFKANEVVQVNEKMRILFATLCLQSSYTPLYNYLENRLKQYGKIVNSQTVKISENEVNSANDLFKGLAIIDTLGGEWKFAKLWQSVMPDANEAFFDRVTRFMDVFFDAIQLKSDTSENADELLNANEILVLKNMMSFSVVVSVALLAKE